MEKLNINGIKVVLTQRVKDLKNKYSDMANIPAETPEWYYQCGVNKTIEEEIWVTENLLNQI